MTDASDSAREGVVHRQTQAYNEGDIDDFAACYGEQAVITKLDEEEIVAEGREDIHSHYGELFEAVPDLSCEVTDEFTVGEFTVCKERVTAGDETLNALAIYLVQEDIIQRLWLGDAQ